jgi:hypothetical protein
VLYPRRMKDRRARRWSFLALTAVLPVACSTDVPARQPEVEPAPDLSPAPAATESESATVTETVDASNVEALAEPPCKVVTGGEPPEEARIRVFASRQDERDEVSLLAGRYQSATFRLSAGNADETLSRVEASGWGTTISALVRTREVPIWVKPSRTVGNGMVTSGPKTWARLVRVEGTSAFVRVQIGSRHIEETIPCDDLVATPPPSAPLARGKHKLLEASRGVEVLPSPTSPAGSGIVIQTPKASTPVLFDIVELERKGRLASVQISYLGGKISGWVPAANVRPVPQVKEREEYGIIGLLSGGSSDGTARAKLEPAGRLVGCPNAVKIAAIPRAGKGPVWVGEVRAITAIGLAERPALFTVQEDLPPPKGWVDVKLFGINARVVARESDLKPCDGW